MLVLIWIQTVQYLIVFLNKSFEKVHFKKSADDNKGMKNYPDLMQRFKCFTKIDGLLYIVNGQSFPNCM